MMRLRVPVSVPVRVHLRVPRLFTLAAGLLMMAAQAQAPGDVRVALVIGNAAYAGEAALVNPVNDARAMADTLGKLGFEVVLLQDSSRAQMADAITRVRTALQGKQAVGMLYYAGHGMQLDWRNYMVPVDAQLRQVGDVAAQTIDVGSVIDAFKAAGNRMNILVLDACRNNPFAGTASGKGLAPLDAPPGTLLAYATAPGNIADDGDVKSGNGLYTQFLLQELARPVARIEDVFKRVRFQVRKQSEGRQIPWESTSLEDDFYFNTGQKPAPPKPTDSAKVAAFDAQKAAWDRIRGSARADDYFAFLQAFPQGELAEAAQFKLDQLARPLVTPTLGKDQAPSLAWTGERFRVGDEFGFERKDALTGVVTSRDRTVVTAIRGDVVEMDGGKSLLTPLGGAIRLPLGTFDPPFASDPAEYQLGKKWEGRTTVRMPSGFVFTLQASFKVIGRETITVPAGTFQTYVVEQRTFSSTGATFHVKLWMDPRYGYGVRREEITRTQGRITNTEIRELVSLKAERG